MKGSIGATDFTWFEVLRGFGLFARCEEAMAELAWEALGEKNGRAFPDRHGEALRSIPRSPAARPESESLRWHSEDVLEREVA